MGSPTQEELDTIPHKTRTRAELLSQSGSRMCVCGYSWSDNPFYCNNKECVYWNIGTLEHSTPVTRLDILYKLVYQKGFCKCKDPKYHTIEDYEICVNPDCFAVLREYEKVVINESLYPRR